LNACIVGRMTIETTNCETPSINTGYAKDMYVKTPRKNKYLKLNRGILFHSGLDNSLMKNFLGIKRFRINNQ